MSNSHAVGYGGLSTLLPEHWLSSQRLAVGARLLSLAQSAGEPTVRLARATFAHLAFPFELNNAADLLAHQEDQYVSRLEALVPTTLASLRSLPDAVIGSRWMAHRKYWDRATLTLRRDGRISPVAGARLIADRLLMGDFTAPQLLRVAVHELNRDWRLVKSVGEALANLIGQLSNAKLTTIDRLAALEELRRSVRLDRWELIENVILQQSFAWPLLVLKTGQSAQEFSLPVAVDVFLDTEDREPFLSDGTIVSDSWRMPLQKALYAAKALWKNKHGAWPRKFRDTINRASVVINLRAAEEIVRPYADWATFELTGRSAETYLALAILGNLVDRSAMEATCATGILGLELPDSEGGGDHYVEPADHPDLKFKYASDACLFDTLLAHSSTVELSTKGHLRVRKGKKLSEYASHAFGQRWRKNRYVRTPDLAIAFRSDDRAERYRFKGRGDTDEEVEYVLRQLKRNDRNPVFEFSGSIKPASIARALYRVRQQSTWRNPSNAKENTGSFVFIRLVPDEINERFWHTVWQAIDGSPDSFFDFRFLTCRTNAAEILSNELNKFNPTPDDPHRAPDVIVLVGSDFMYRAHSPIANGPFVRLQLQSLRKVLETKLAPTPVPGIREQIGRTRIILVPTEESQVYDHITPSQQSALSPELAEAIEKLSIFRFGFTFEMARHVLGVTDEVCETLLEALKQEKWYEPLGTHAIPQRPELVEAAQILSTFRDGFSFGMARQAMGATRQVCEDNLESLQLEGTRYLRHAEGAGEYVLQLRAELLKERLADQHFAAADSILGFLEPADEVLRLHQRQALSPIWLHEAQWHLNRARSLGGPDHPASTAQERLSRIGEPFGWTRIRWATERSKEDSRELLDALKEHIAKVKSRGWKGYRHPIEFLLAAKFAHQLVRRLTKDPEESAQVVELRADSRRFLKWAERACSNLSIDERDACRYVVATSRACMILSEEPNPNGLRQAADDFLTARALKKFEGELLDLSWFEYIGDREWEGRDDQACNEYASGIKLAVARKQKPLPSTVIKYIGAAARAGIVPSTETLRAIELVKKSNPWPRTKCKFGLFELKHVQERWQHGRSIFLTGDMSVLNGIPVDCENRHAANKNGHRNPGMRGQRRRSSPIEVHPVRVRPNHDEIDHKDEV